MARPFAFAWLVLVVAIAGCGGGEPAPVGPQRATTTTTLPDLPSPPPLERLALEPVAEGLSEPVAIATARAIDEVFIVERTGRIVTLSSDGRDAVLDLNSRIGWEVNEQGLLGLAVHPDFPRDPRGFVVYTDTDFDVVVSSFTWNGDRFDASSEHVVLEVAQPHKYHQGGGILFGPRGDLWLSFGDGGGNGDPYGNGQNPDTLNGTIVRIDVDNADPYAVPPDNPFVESDDGAPEVFAYGLRNPWRFTIDGDNLIIADVGQYSAEEIDIVSVSGGGENFGWPVLEADECFEAETCDRDGMTMPVVVIPHERVCAIIGGVVYRGTAIPELHGHYLFGDHCVGWMRSAPVEGSGLGRIKDWEATLGSLGMVTTFATDPDGEVLIANLEGEVHRLIPVRTSG
jgi:glucose/arabinose dehydrogenase